MPANRCAPDRQDCGPRLSELAMVEAGRQPAMPQGRREVACRPKIARRGLFERSHRDHHLGAVALLPGRHFIDGLEDELDAATPLVAQAEHWSWACNWGQGQGHCGQRARCIAAGFRGFSRKARGTTGPLCPLPWHARLRLDSRFDSQRTGARAQAARGVMPLKATCSRTKASSVLKLTPVSR